RRRCTAAGRRRAGLRRRRRQGLVNGDGMPEFDLVIIGGGIIGGSTLYHLSKLGYKGKVVILEREDALSKGSTAFSAGGFRNIWTTPINMKLTSYSIQRLAHFREELDWPIGFDQRGYLFCQFGDSFETA